MADLFRFPSPQSGSNPSTAPDQGDGKRPGGGGAGMPPLPPAFDPEMQRRIDSVRTEAKNLRSDAIKRAVAWGAVGAGAGLVVKSLPFGPVAWLVGLGLGAAVVVDVLSQHRAPWPVPQLPPGAAPQLPYGEGA
jgi:hypothetical protein